MSNRVAGYVEAIACVRLETEQWIKLARGLTGDQRAVAMAVAAAMKDLTLRMIESLNSALDKAAPGDISQ